MQLLSSSYLCTAAAAAATPLHRLCVGQCRSSVELFVASRRGRGSCTSRRRLHAQPQEDINVTDLRNAPTPEEEEPAPANPPYNAGLSEEDIREAMLFEQGGGEEGPRLEEAARAGEGDSGVKYERTIPIPSATRGPGHPIVSILTVFAGLLDRPFGGGASVAAAGSAVVERVQDEIEKLKEEDRVNEQLLFEVIRVTRLLDMDMKLLSAAHKEATLLERLDSARKHCSEAILLADAL